MIDIDFLPISYRQQTVHRKANVWRLLVGGGFALTLVFSFVYQQFLFRHAVRQLDEVTPEYEQTQALSRRLAQAQAQLQSAAKQAELFTYLRNPWPRTQILAAALARLPDCVTLGEIHIARSQCAAGPAAPRRLLSKKEQEAEAKKWTPAERDLRRLCAEAATRETTLVLSGRTTDTANLQRYLVAVGQDSLFTKVELTSLEASPDRRRSTWRFTARLVVRPGYGRPGGPELAQDDARRAP